MDAVSGFRDGSYALAHIDAFEPEIAGTHSHHFGDSSGDDAAFQSAQFGKSDAGTVMRIEAFGPEHIG